MKRMSLHFILQMQFIAIFAPLFLEIYIVESVVFILPLSNSVHLMVPGGGTRSFYMKINNRSYERPQVVVMDVEIEEGFAASTILEDLKEEDGYQEW